MTEKRCRLKRNIKEGDVLSFEDNRIFLQMEGKSGNAALILLQRGQGPDVRRSLYPNELLTLDGGRILLQMERRTGSKARFLVDMAESVRLAPQRKDAEPDAPAQEGDGVPAFGGHL